MILVGSELKVNCNSGTASVKVFINKYWYLELIYEILTKSKVICLNACMR